MSKKAIGCFMLGSSLAVGIWLAGMVREHFGPSWGVLPTIVGFVLTLSLWMLFGRLLGRLLPAPDASPPVPPLEKTNPRLKEDESFRKEFVAELEKGAHGEVNRVDAMLVLMQSGSVSLPQLFAALDEAELYSLVRNADSLNQPLTVKHPDGYGLVALFSSPDRAEPTIQQFPEFAELLRMRFRDIIEVVGEGLGIVINPLHEVATFQMTPQQVAGLRKHYNDPSFP